MTERDQQLEVSITIEDAGNRKIAAGVFAILLGFIGIHKLILGYSTEGLAMLLITIFAGLVIWSTATVVVWAFDLAEGIIYLARTDEEFLKTYFLLHKKAWF